MFLDVAAVYVCVCVCVCVCVYVCVCVHECLSECVHVCLNFTRLHVHVHCISMKKAVVVGPAIPGQLFLAC